MNRKAGSSEFDGDWLREAMDLRPQTPDGRSGKISVTSEVQPAGKVLEAVSMRNAIFMGQAPCRVRFDEDLTYRHLRHDDRGEWMSDSAQEIYQCREPINAIRKLGNCELLIGGLGLGCYSAIALGMTDARVTTVEIDRHVIELVGEHVRDHKIRIDRGPFHRVVRGCIYKHAKQMAAGRYDAAILDTWQPTGEMCWVTEVIPLRRIVRPKVAVVFCWNEQEMIGQFRMGVCRKLLFNASELPIHDTHYRTIRAVAQHEGLVGPGFTMDAAKATGFDSILMESAKLENDPKVQQLVNAFCQDIGSPEWEQRFGRFWDQAAAEPKSGTKRKCKPRKQANERKGAMM